MWRNSGHEGAVLIFEAFFSCQSKNVKSCPRLAESLDVRPNIDFNTAAKRTRRQRCDASFRALDNLSTDDFSQERKQMRKKLKEADILKWRGLSRVGKAVDFQCVTSR